VVAATQHRRHLAQRVLRRPGVVRTVEHAVLEAVLAGRVGVIERAVLQPAHGVDQHRGRQFTAGKHVVADRHLFVDVVFDEALVDAFVAAADQHQPRPRCQLAHLALVKPCALGAEVHHVRGARIGGTHGVQRLDQRIDQHDHAGTAAVGAVVDMPVRQLRKVAQLPGHHLQQAATQGAAHHTEFRRPQDELGKQAEHVDAQRRRPGPGAH
jgi:hypothetical protein